MIVQPNDRSLQVMIFTDISKNDLFDHTDHVINWTISQEVTITPTSV